jgi:hypothetical protein
MSYSLVTAAAATGVSRTTVLRAINAGKISAERDAQGAWVIQPGELHRVFPPLPLLAAPPAQVQSQVPAMSEPEKPLGLADLRAAGQARRVNQGLVATPPE